MISRTGRVPVNHDPLRQLIIDLHSIEQLILQKRIVFLFPIQGNISLCPGDHLRRCWFPALETAEEKLLKSHPEKFNSRPLAASAANIYQLNFFYLNSYSRVYNGMHFSTPQI